MSASRGRLMTIPEGADYLGVSIARLRRAIARDEIAVLRNSHGRFEGVYAEALDEWVARRTRPARVAAAAAGRSVDAAIAKLMPTSRRYAS